MKKYNLIFTLDYEIHGNGDGSPFNLMIEPTSRLLNLLDKYNAKLTVMADVAEILCFKKYYEETGVDKFSYKEIEKQLQETIRRGHDVQLHIHSSYFGASYNGHSWEQNWPEYNLAALPYERINKMIGLSKQFLEDTLKPISADYCCHVFRAANWSMMPTPNIYRALINNGINIDTSVYKGGQQKGNAVYDYTDAYSHIYSYKVDANDINKYNGQGELTEYPIFTEMRYFWSFITPIRVFRMVRAKFHKHQLNSVESEVPKSNDNRKLFLKSFFIKSPWKLDFNQASGWQLINALKRIKRETKNDDTQIDIILIGHSKTFIPYNKKSLEKFLRWVALQNNIDYSLFEKL